ncbi:chromosome segregation protein SMC [Lactobacillus xylocopicola]|uniref:Chromosome partition protein Smc n=1 Tax=Lactobacillus xylocopicola TaxID=2976676 RepID=A0ABN6SJZ1_9LACO|nr:chromosome segregation protein SMC [Lactobacillus xylocopicola]BDR60667.1 chromosome partition protein Smc [Lactobacillus xylocopicola]
MPLTELTIDGFKSFAEKTKIKFDSGITGIVGPNGSGKSNITEAIRWVMGESSAKSLRGSNMKDVIFAGSEFRKPATHAEVALVFDNKKHELNFDADQVVVTRRILRSGDNEYLINKHSVRQRDVRALFMDSGISQDSLAIISQGRVDQILNSRPEDRRSLFEEAAGILHFKKQKEEASAQLEQTTENLVRINDLVKELEQRIEPLHEQSSLAKEYQFQKSGLDHDLKTLLAFEIEDLNQQKQGVQQQADQNQVLLSKLDREVKESQSAVAAKRDEYKQISTQREQIQHDLLVLTKKLSDINTNLQVAEQSKQYSEATKKEYRTELTDLKEQASSLAAECATLKKQAEELTKEQKQLQDQRRGLTKRLDSDPKQLNQQLEDLRAAYIQLLQDQTSNNNEIVYLQSELNRAGNDDDYQNDDVSKQLDQSTAELERLRKQGTTLKEKYQAQKSKLATLTAEQAQKQAKLADLQQVVNKNNQRYSQVQARYEALENIRKRHEGYYYGVKNVLNHLPDYPGVIGAIGELITFPAKLEAAMATALGGGVQDLVTTSRVSARDAINQLKSSRAGRATFLPLDGLREYSIPSSTVKIMESYDGFQGIASELVASNTTEDISPAINYLLGSTVIVDTIDHALNMRQRIARYRIVTLDGDVIAPGGSMTGGARNQKNNSPLQTVAELNELKQNIKILKQKLATDQAKFSQLTAASASLDQEIDQVRLKEQEYNRELGEAVLSYQNQEKEVKRLKAASELLESRQAERAKQVAELQTKIKKAEDQKEGFVQQIDKQKAAISDIQDRIKNYTSLNQQVQDKLAELDPQLAVLSNKLENLAKQKTEKEHSLTQCQRQIEGITEKLTALEQTGTMDQEKKQELNAEIKQESARKEDLERELGNLSAKLGQYDAKITQLDQVASRNYDLRKAAASEQENLSVKIAQLAGKIDQRLEKLRKEYALTFEAALKQAEDENNDETRARLQKSVRLHQLSLADIGPVNLQAIDEYEDVKKRYDFLIGQQEDLLKGRDNLRESMAELDSEVCSRFNKTFNAVAKSFAELYPVVFGGGSARLVLTDPEDLLTTGVEIVAQPPGKKLQRLSLLSGGERALTAITLLFAMLKVKPVPFCVLDEVEAALDDANVTRFAEFLEKYDMHTQFIVITHRRGTMERADQLYGVVMQESGVSQVLSVSLKELKDEVS